MIPGVPLRLAGLDSGKQKDSTALVGLTVQDEKARIHGARRWFTERASKYDVDSKGRRYIDMEDDIALLHMKHPHSYYAIEINNVGIHVYEALKFQKKLPCVALTTAKDIKDPKKLALGRTMDKNAMTRIMVDWFASGVLVFPPMEQVKANPDMFELYRQLTIFSEHKTDSGSISYYAEGNEHDDLVMGLMDACFLARRFLRLGGTKIAVGRLGSHQHERTDYNRIVSN